MPARQPGTPSRARTTSASAKKTSPKSRGPKSHKADGTPKKRWTSAERNERGVAPRRGGGTRSTSRGDRGPRTDERNERTTERGYDRSSESRPRPDRRETDQREDRRPVRNDRDETTTRTPREDRPTRSYDNDRPARSFSDRPARSFDRDRPARSFDRRDDRRDDRPARSTARDDRPARSYDNDRPARSFDRSDRPARSYDNDRPARSYDNDRPARSFDRNDRPARDDRPARSFDRRDDRPARSYDNDRPARSYNNDRPARSFDRNDRNDRPARSFDRNDRPARSFDRNDRPARSFDRNDRDDRTESNPDQMSWDAETVVTPIHTPAAGTADGPSGFAELGVDAVLADALKAQGIVDPFPIQRSTIPDALSGRDVLGRGRTGSGKTLGFGLPMISRLAGRKGTSPRGLVLVPTRELALQVADVLAPLARTLGLGVTLIAGGMAYGPQIKALSRGVDIVVSTPGRLIDLMDQGAADLTAVEVTVLDEADHMADLGFLPAVTQIMETVPGDGQRMLFSATLDSGVGRIVRTYLHDPVTHEVDGNTASVTTMEHHVLNVQPMDKARLTAEIAGRPGRTVVFVRTQRGADRVAEQLRDSGVMAGALHGGLTQGARSRTLDAFKDGRVGVLVATDVAARGIHVDDVSLVLQADPPAGPKEYLHRAGRTARAGDKGVVVTFALPHQKRELQRLTRDAGVKAAPLDTRPGDPALAVTGAVSPSGSAIATEEYQRLIAPPASQRSHRPGGRGQGGRGQGGRGRGSFGGGPRGRRHGS